MEKKLILQMKEEGIIEITEQDLEREFQSSVAEDRKTVTSYWKSDGSGHSEQYIAHFNILSPQQVKVTTTTKGKVNVNLHFYNITQNHAGPTLPQTGGMAGLDSGYWKLYFTGSITSYPTPSGIWATVTYQ